MLVNLGPAITAGGDFTGDGLAAWTHQGNVLIRGYLFTSGSTAQTITVAGGIPAGLLPDSAPISVTLNTSVALSDPQDFEAGHHYPDLDITHPSTVNADGSWTLDTPLDASYAYVQLLFTAQWEHATPAPDSPGGWQSLGPLLDPAWSNIDAEYTAHGDTLHLRGNIELAADQHTYGLPIIWGAPGGLPNPANTDGYTTVEADAGGYTVPAEISVNGGGTVNGASLVLNGRPTPKSSLIAPDFRVAGGLTTKSYPGETGTTSSGVHRTLYPVDLTGTDWAAGGDYPHYSWDTFRVIPQWWTPWWTWTTSLGQSGFAPGPIDTIPTVPNVDLAAAIAAMAWPPDWVTIMFQCSMSLRYVGYQTLADAQADAGTEQNPLSPYSNAHKSTATVAVTPQVSGVSNRKFVDSGTYDASPGPYTGSLGDSAAGFDPYNAMEPFAAKCYLAPATPVYAPRKIIEPAGLEHAQLLWDPADVGTASVDIFGEAQAGNVSVTWTVAPFWELPDDYLIAGDTITFTQRSWWPTIAAAGNFMMVL